MASFIKPSGLSKLWAAAGTKVDPGAAKTGIGWVVELPPYQYQNWLDNKQDTFIAHSNQHGIPEWDTETEYQGGLSYTKGSNGVIYKCLQTHTNIDPVNPLNNLYWARAFEDYGSVATVQSALTSHIANYQTLAGISNVVAARNNLSVWSKSESDSRFAYKAGSSSQVFAVSTATQPEHAVRLSQVQALLVAATESVTGVIRIATSGEVSSGTNDTKAVTPLKLASQYLSKAGNLAGLANVATARSNLGLGTAATQNLSAFLQPSNNLSEISSPTIARSNLGLQTTATTALNLFLLKADNLAGLTNVNTARTNLELGSSATRNVGTTANTVAAGDDSRIVTAVPNTRTVSAGNGLTGGGALTSNLSLNIGTPSSVSASSSNSVTATSHTHAFDVNSFFGNRSLGATGYYEFPGGFKVQWGVASIGGGANQTTNVTFPQAFSSEVFGVQCTYRQNTDNDGDSHWVQNESVTGFTLGNDGAANSVFWFAYGV